MWFEFTTSSMYWMWIEVFDLTKNPSAFVNVAGKPEAGNAKRELRTALLDWMILACDFLPLRVTCTNAGAKNRTVS